MRAFEFIFEGGWASTATQGTIITPSTVKSVLNIMQTFTSDFNRYLKEKGLGPVRVGKPTGSTAYHDIDKEDHVYGDIDLQMITPEMEDENYSKYSTYWNMLTTDFIQKTKPNYIHPTESKVGHPLISIGPGKYVQLDFMWHPEKLSTWGAARVTPEHGLKGLLYGNVFSVLGEVLDMSIQHTGVNLKVSGDQRVPFSKRKDTKLVTVTTNPNTFVLDIFEWLAARQGLSNPKITKELIVNPGVNTKEAKVSTLIKSVKGFAKSLESNNMFGKADLKDISSYSDFMNKFITRYVEKANDEVNNAKRNKAATSDAIARAESDRNKIKNGLSSVMQLFKDPI